ncbi:MAG: hypothetical protein ACR2OC_01515 [Solirubrobacterales bacterium]
MATVLLIGEGDLTEETAAALEASGAEVERLAEPDEEMARAALAEGRSTRSRSSPTGTPTSYGSR